MPLPPRLRHQLILGKFPIIEIKTQPTQFEFVLDMGKGLYIITHAPLTSDLRIGDLLTLYTEVLVQRKH
jgi:hypothetical protein